MKNTETTAQPKKEDLIKPAPFTEEQLSNNPWNHMMFKGWESIGFSEGRTATYDYMKANPDCSFSDLIENVKFEKEL